MYKMCNNDSYLTFQCLVNKQQSSNSADIFIQYFFFGKNDLSHCCEGNGHLPDEQIK